jgi:glycosyltransferase involved in cell wall biosynthesis
MTDVRVLRVYHSAVVDEYRQRERALRKYFGYDVHLVCPPRWLEGGVAVEAPPASDLPVHVVPIRGRAHPILFWYRSVEFRKILREVDPHIVDLHEEPYSLAVAVARRAVRDVVPQAKICIYSAQNIHKEYPPPFRHFERRALATAVAAYPCSTEAGEVLRAKGFEGALHVLPLGVSIPPRTDRPSEAPFSVGFLGRLEPYKGAEIAVRAFAQASVGVNATLEIVGTGSQHQALMHCARELGISDRVGFCGALSQDEALRRIGTYDLVVIPSLTTSSWKEQFGRVAAQALAAGTAVLASDSGSLPEVLGGCGELAREGDAGHFGSKMAALLRDPARLAVLSTTGRARAMTTFSWESVAHGFDRMYRRALAGDGRDFSYVAGI